jgi:hypothetical protein
MITRNNLLAEYPRIFQSALPKALQQEEFDFVAENIDLYGDDPDIAKYVDTFIEKLNEVLEKQKGKAFFLAKKKTRLHAFDVEIYCEEGMEKPLKSRFGKKDEVKE